jgi:hypothetical protein
MVRGLNMAGSTNMRLSKELRDVKQELVKLRKEVGSLTVAVSQGDVSFMSRTSYGSSRRNEGYVFSSAVTKSDKSATASEASDSSDDATSKPTTAKSPSIRVPMSRRHDIPESPLAVKVHAHGGAPRSETPKSPLRSAQLDRAQAGLKSTGLMHEAHQVFTLADWDTSNTLDSDELAKLRTCLRHVNPDLYPHPLTPDIADKVSHPSHDAHIKCTVPYMHPSYSYLSLTPPSWLPPARHPSLCAPSLLAPSACAQVVGEAMDSNGDGVIDRGEWIDFITSQAREVGERPMLKLMQILNHALQPMWRTNGYGPY